MSRSRWQLRDAAVGYASRGIPVLPLHYPLPHRTGLQPGSGDPQAAVERAGCSCRDPSCGQVGKHPMGSLVPHGVKDATTNRARVLAWWTCHPQANIGLATGLAFDVLDVDGPAGAQAIREFAATHGFQGSGPLVRTRGSGWHYYLAPTGLGNVQPQGLAHVDWRGRGGYVVAPPSRHYLYFAPRSRLVFLVFADSTAPADPDIVKPPGCDRLALRRVRARPVYRTATAAPVPMSEPTSTSPG
jgi:hypothetical protein